MRRFVNDVRAQCIHWKSNLEKFGRNPKICRRIQPTRRWRVQERPLLEAFAWLKSQWVEIRSKFIAQFERHEVPSWSIACGQKCQKCATQSRSNCRQKDSALGWAYPEKPHWNRFRSKLRWRIAGIWRKRKLGWYHSRYHRRVATKWL